MTPRRADAVPGAPHPSETTRLIGQEAAEAALLDVVASDRPHHALMLAGPRGVGKATLAYRAARALIAHRRPSGLDVEPDHPVARRVRAGSEPRLRVLRREWDPARERLPEVIGVDTVRDVIASLALSAPDGGRRAVIVDAADDLNVQAANALLKVLEEPPDRTTFLLVAHRPSALLPTIRSRCRTVRLRTLAPREMAEAIEARDAAALGALAGGSVGEAWRLAAGGGLEVYGEIAALFGTMPGMDRVAALGLAEGISGRGAEDRRDLVVRLLETALARVALTGAGRPPEAEAVPEEGALLRRLAPGPGAGRLWAEAQLELGGRLRGGLAVNLDPATLLLDILRRIDDTAARAVRPARRPNDDGARDPAPA